MARYVKANNDQLGSLGLGGLLDGIKNTLDAYGRSVPDVIAYCAGGPAELLKNDMYQLRIFLDFGHKAIENPATVHLEHVHGLANYLQKLVGNLQSSVAAFDKHGSENCPVDQGGLSEEADAWETFRIFRHILGDDQALTNEFESGLDSFEDSLVLADDEAYADIAEIAHMQIADSDAIACAAECDS
eukprot:tig00021521_g22077.t1